MIASFSALGVDLPYIALIVLHSFVVFMIQHLHKLYPLLSFMFVRYSGDLIVHLWQGGRARVSGSEVLFSNISVGTGSVLSRCRPEGMFCDAALRMMARKIFSLFWQLVGSRLLRSACLQYLYCIGPSFPFSD